MTIFGIIWIIILIFIFFQFDLKKMAFLTMFSMVLQCSNAIVIDKLMVGPHVITNIVFLMLYLFKKRNLKIDKPQKIRISILCIFLAIIISSIFNNTLDDNILKIVQISTYMLNFLLMYKMRLEFNNQEIYKFIKHLSIFVLIIGFIQIMSSSNLIPRFTIINELFFNDRSYNVYYWHDNYFRFTSVFMEPSYCSCFLVGALFYFLSIWDNKTKKNYFLIGTLVIAILLTKSSSGYAAFGIGTILFLIFSKNKQIKKILLPLSIIGCIILLIFFRDTLNEVIFSKANSGSANTRYYWNKSALNAFNTSKIIGIGYKNVRGSSIVCSLLGELGIFGLLSYAFLNAQLIIPIFNKKYQKNLQFAGIRFGILAIIIIQIIAVPDLDLCIYWLFLDILAIHKNIPQKEKGEVTNE